MRSLVTFRSDAFRKGGAGAEPIHPASLGEDLAGWIIAASRAQGIQTEEEPLQEDYGWVVTMVVEGVPHWIILGYRPVSEDEGDDWVAWVERKRSLLGLLRRRRGRVPNAAAVRAVHRILEDAPEITDLRWHVAEEFERGREEGWRPAP